MSSKSKVKVTFYGWPDNDPSGKAIAYPKSDGYKKCVHDEAGGDGTYDDPITVAVITKENGGNWEPGTRMYVSSLKKYFIVEDECAEGCEKNQIDIWMESNKKNDEDAVIKCQEAWTPDGKVEVVIDPDEGLPVNKKPFFDVRNDTCNA
jgi:3D (Asp-Asp-Asp) domain-containing protein